MNNEFKYEIDNDFKEYFADEVLSAVVNGNARISLINSNLPFPNSSKNENGHLELQFETQYKLIKHIKANIIIPIDFLPSIIDNLQRTYDNAQALKNGKKEE